MSGVKENPSHITKYMCKLRGGSQPIFIRASDGLFYVVKFTNNPQGANVLFNESIGTELYRAYKLPVPEWKSLLVTDAFLDENPGCWMETADKRLRPASGMCFGSRFLFGDNNRLLEILPGTSFKRVHNRLNFWLAWLIDICAGHTDNRQAIFTEDRRGGLDAFFVDHGHLFGGPNGEESRLLPASRYYDPRIYQSVSPRHLRSFQDAVKGLNVDCLWQKVLALPDDWKTRSAIIALARCLNRLSSAGLVENILETMVDAIQQKQQKSGDKCTLPHTGPIPPVSVACHGVRAVAQGQQSFAC